MAIPKYLNRFTKNDPEHIISLIKERRLVRKDIKLVSNPDAKAALRTEYNKLSVLIKKSIKDHTELNWKNFLGKLGPYPPSTREFWNVINRARTQKKSGSIPSLVSEGREFKSDEEKANLFASILGETFTLDSSSSDFDLNHYDFVHNFVENFDFSDASFSLVSFCELDEVLKKLKTGSSPGEDQVHNLMLKNLPPRGVNLLLKLVNASLAQGLPNELKTALITMIPKKETKSSLPADYRPISLTSCIGKVVERVVKNRLYRFLESKNLIVKEQSGFRNKRGTADNLLFMSQKIRECILRERMVCGIYFDISKAFDKVWHDGLIYKMICLGVPLYMVKFIKFFLANRKFRVKINNFISDLFDILCSVPQGSVLGPLLFLVFIMDIPLANSLNKSYSALFADDLGSIFIFTRKELKKVEVEIKKYLESLVKWLFKWRLKMNASKCCYTIFSSKGRSGISLDLLLNNELIPYNSNPVFLGIKFDEHLNFNAHCVSLRERALKRLNIIKIFSHKSWHLNKSTLINIYRSLIGSIFDYSFFIVASCSETSLDSLQRVQNRAVRCIFKLRYDSRTDELFPLSGVLPLEARFVQLGSRYLLKAKRYGNKFTMLLVSEYIRSYSAITAKKLKEINKKYDKKKKIKLSTPLCMFLTMIAITQCFLIILALNILSFRIFLFDLLYF